MSLPHQIAAYTDCFEHYTAALEDDIGLRIKVPNRAGAEMLRMRLHQARRLSRDESKRTYDRTDPRWNKSEFDSLKVTIRQDTDNGWWTYITRHGQEVGVIERLSEVETDTTERLSYRPGDHYLPRPEQPIPEIKFPEPTMVTTTNPIKRRF